MARDEQNLAEGVGASSTVRRRRLWRRRWLWVLGGVVAVLAGVLICVGPWPAYDAGYEGTAYAEATFARIDAWDADAVPGALQAGVAAVEITPRAGEPLAGYSAREPKACSGADEALHAKAITLANGRATVTILGGDILLVMPALRDAILDRLDLPREQVYFTATHTHAGPGGFSGRWVDEIVLGDHDPAVADRLADRFAEAVRRSRADLRPATMELHTLRPTPERAASYIRNRLAADGPAHGTVHVLLWCRADAETHETQADAAAGAPGEPAGVPLAALVVASPHPTCLGHENRRASGDYPGVVQRRLAAKYGCEVLFAAGAVGSMGPAEAKPRGPERAEDVGTALATAAAEAPEARLLSRSQRVRRALKRLQETGEFADHPLHILLISDGQPHDAPENDAPADDEHVRIYRVGVGDWTSPREADDETGSASAEEDAEALRKMLVATGVRELDISDIDDLANRIPTPEGAQTVTIVDRSLSMATRDGPDGREAVLASFLLPVDLPPLQYRLSDDWRLSPIAARYLHGRRTYVHVLRIGEAVLLGMPCDYSGELAVALEAWAAEHAALTPVVTSFNGDYIGYVLPTGRYELDHYEARDLNLFGPACGAYLDAVARRVLGRWAAPEATAASLGAQAAAGAQAAGPQ